ncbi:PAS domain S-box protein [Dankookia sp. GCM10030260]|uniref:PAS domain-containing sensor histidine kinase n=1 Tax=Dankookia sp. GCM10030260 TaxID=3273390 RepID=UPI00361A422D
MNGRTVDLSRHRLPSLGRLAELVLESSADFAVFTICLDGVITSWNSAAERVMGWSEDEVVGRDACMIFTSEDQAAGICAAEMATARSSGRAKDERWHMRKDGSRYWGSGSMTRLEDDETGEHLGYVKIVRDRTAEHLAGERLQASEALLRNVMESSADCLKLLDLQGRLTFMNAPGLCAMEVEEFRTVDGKEWVSLWPEEQRNKLRAAMAEALAGRVGRLQGFCPTAKGTPRWWDVQVTAVPGEGGQPSLLLASSRDVTEQRRAEERLRESEAQLRLQREFLHTLIRQAPVGISITEAPSGRAVVLNDKAREILGHGELGEDATRYQAYGAVHPDGRPFAIEDYPTMRTLRHGEVVKQEEIIYRRHGDDADGSASRRRLEVSSAPVRDGSGRIAAAVTVLYDIEERRRAEEARSVVEERYRLAVRATNDAIWDWDLRRDCIEWNEALNEAYGYHPEDVDPSGGWWIEHIHPEDRGRVFRSIHAVIDGTGTHWSDEYRFLRADGTYADVLDRGFMVRGPDGVPVRMLGAMLDLTERRHAERELRRLNEHLENEVARRAEQLRQQEDVLRQSQKLEAIGQLTGGVAHDFNNLLTVIRSSAGLLRRPSLPEDRRRRYVEAIAETADRAAKLTGQLLAFARRQPLKPEVFAVGDRVASVVALVRPLVGARVRIETEIECEDCAVKADPNQFETALLNLAVNARDAMDGEGRLTLRTWLASGVPATRGHAGAPGAFVAVSVTDTGSGIASEMMGRIFEPFFTTKEVGKGTGLGLSQVYGFAKQSGGELQVESEVGRGTTFTLYLLRAKAKPLAGC